jgi:hypothetical protein
MPRPLFIFCRILGASFFLYMRAIFCILELFIELLFLCYRVQIIVHVNLECTVCLLPVYPPNIKRCSYPSLKNMKSLVNSGNKTPPTTVCPIGKQRHFVQVQCLLRSRKIAHPQIMI